MNTVVGTVLNLLDRRLACGPPREQWRKLPDYGRDSKVSREVWL
jgi:hypothetical protein